MHPVSHQNMAQKTIIMSIPKSQRAQLNYVNTKKPKILILEENKHESGLPYTEEKYNFIQNVKVDWNLGSSIQVQFSFKGKKKPVGKPAPFRFLDGLNRASQLKVSGRKPQPAKNDGSNGSVRRTFPPLRIL
jgi:hypothetical protein